MKRSKISKQNAGNLYLNNWDADDAEDVFDAQLN